MVILVCKSGCDEESIIRNCSKRAVAGERTAASLVRKTLRSRRKKAFWVIRTARLSRNRLKRGLFIKVNLGGIAEVAFRPMFMG